MISVFTYSEIENIITNAIDINDNDHKVVYSNRKHCSASYIMPIPIVTWHPQPRCLYLCWDSNAHNNTISMNNNKYYYCKF